MLSVQTEKNIIQILLTLSEGERNIEVSRQVLSDNYDFDSMQIFKYLDIEGKNYIDSNNILNFLRYKNIPVNNLEVFFLIFFYDLDFDGFLSYPEFLNLIQSEKSLMKQIDTNKRIDKLSYNIEYSLTKLLEKEIILSRNLLNLLKNLQNKCDFNIHNIFHFITKYNYITSNNFQFFFDINCVNYLESDLNFIMKRLDLNKDGKIDFIEFHNFFGFPNCSICCPCAQCENCGCLCLNCEICNELNQGHNHLKFVNQNYNHNNRKSWEMINKDNLFNASNDYNFNKNETNNNLSNTNLEMKDTKPSDFNNNNIINNDFNSNEGNFYNNNEINNNNNDNNNNNNNNDNNIDNNNNNINNINKENEANNNNENEMIIYPSQSNSNNMQINNQNNLNNSPINNQNTQILSESLHLRNSPQRNFSPYGKLNHNRFNFQNSPQENNNNNQIIQNINPNHIEEEQLIVYLRSVMDAESQLENTKINISKLKDFNIECCFRIFEKTTFNCLSPDDIKCTLRDLEILVSNSDLDNFFKRYDIEKKGFIDFADFFDIVIPFDKNYRDSNEKKEPFCCDSKSFEFFSYTTRIFLKNLFNSIFNYESKFNFIKINLTTLRLKLIDLFKTIDVQNKGFFTVQDLSNYLHRNKIFTNMKDCNLLFIRLDKKRDGKIDYEEFKEELEPIF